MSITDWVNCFLTAGIVIFACLQWRCTNSQKNTEMFKLKVNHIKELKAFWDELHNDIKYIPQYRAELIINENYPENKELELLETLDKVLPYANIDASIFTFNQNTFDSIEELYSDLYKELVDKL